MLSFLATQAEPLQSRLISDLCREAARPDGPADTLGLHSCDSRGRVTRSSGDIRAIVRLAGGKVRFADASRRGARWSERQMRSEAVLTGSREIGFRNASQLAAGTATAGS
jgi:hypothetical protein